MILKRNLSCDMTFMTGHGNEANLVQQSILDQQNCFRAHPHLSATPPGRTQPEAVLYAPIESLIGLDLITKYDAMFQFCLTATKEKLRDNIKTLMIVMIVPSNLEPRTESLNPKLMMSHVKNMFQDIHVNFIFIETDLINALSQQWQRLINHELDALLVMAIDSLFGDELTMFINQQHVQTIAYHQGIIPGEAAVSLLFTYSPSYGNQQLKICQSTMTREQSVTAELLASQINALVAKINSDINDIKYCLTDFVNNNQDAKLLYLVERELWGGDMEHRPQQISTAKCFGYIGVANVLLQFASAWRLLSELTVGSILLINRHEPKNLILLNKQDV